MSKVPEYRSKAALCHSEACHALWPELRETWLQISDSYRHLADHEERAEEERRRSPGLP